MRDHPLRLRLGVAVTGLVFLLLPRLNGWSALHVHKEDGSIFLTEALHTGPSVILHTYSGYLHVAPRLVTELALTVSSDHPQWFPLAVAALTALVRVAFFWLATATLADHGVSERWAVLAASPFLLVAAGQWEVLGNVTNLRWTLVPALLFALLGRGSTTAQRAMGLAVATLAPLSDPLAVLLAPVAVAQLVRGSTWARVTAVVSLAATAGQLLALQPGDRPPYLYPLDHPVGAVAQWIVRGPVEATYGVTGTESLLYVGGPILACLAVALPAVVVALGARRDQVAETPRWLPWLLLGYGWGILAATLTFAAWPDLSLSQWFAPATPSRYAVPAAILIGAALVLFAQRALRARSDRVTRLAVVALAAVTVVAVLVDFRGDAYDTQGPRWATTIEGAQHRCEGQREPDVTVQVTPTGVPLHWTATLPCSWVTTGR